jgi:glycerophosphoryl diester phosphodiesterase
VVAHRGDSFSYPENTSIAFAAAIAANVDGIELDVRLSHDGIPMICHDATLQRYGGSTLSLRQMTAAQIQAVDVGAWKRQHFIGQRAPTLDQALTQCRGVTLCIELKATNGPGRTAYHRRLLRAVLDAITRRRAERRVCILCFDGGVLEQISRMAPNLRRVRNCERLPTDLDRWLDRQPGLHAACFDRRILTQAVVDTCHRHGVQVYAWSANDASAANRLMTLGVDAILSDRPAWLVRHLRG